MSKAQELKLCPFCNGSRAFVSDSESTAIHIVCRDCGAQLWGCKRHFSDEASAISAWNTRAPASSEQQAAQQDAERDQAIGHAVQRAFADLPEGSEVLIHLEKGAGTVYMTDWDGYEYDHFQSDDGFGDVINQAIDGAIAADAAAHASNGGKA